MAKLETTSRILAQLPTAYLHAPQLSDMPQPTHLPTSLRIKTHLTSAANIIAGETTDGFGKGRVLREVHGMRFVNCAVNRAIGAWFWYCRFWGCGWADLILRVLGFSGFRGFGFRGGEVSGEP